MWEPIIERRKANEITLDTQLKGTIEDTIEIALADVRNIKYILVSLKGVIEYTLIKIDVVKPVCLHSVGQASDVGGHFPQAYGNAWPTV